MLLVGVSTGVYYSIVYYTIGGLGQFFDADIHDCYLYVYYNMISTVYIRLLGVCILYNYVVMLLL